MENTIDIVFTVRIPKELDKEKAMDADFMSRSRGTLVKEATKSLADYTEFKEKFDIETQNSLNNFKLNNGIIISWEVDPVPSVPLEALKGRARSLHNQAERLEQRAMTERELGNVHQMHNLMENAKAHRLVANSLTGDQTG